MNIKKPNIILADSDAIDMYAPEVAQILIALDHPEALVTDESQLSDFSSVFPSDADTFEGVEVLVGRPVDGSERIWKLARELRAKKQKPTVH